MKKIIFFTFFISFFIGIQNFYGFCIHNLSNITVGVNQTYGGKGYPYFSVFLQPGEVKCCDWRNDKCNVSGKKDSIVRFNIFYTVSLGKYIKVKAAQFICTNFEIRADGSIYVINKNKCSTTKKRFP